MNDLFNEVEIHLYYIYHNLHKFLFDSLKHFHLYENINTAYMQNFYYDYLKIHVFF